MTRRYPPDNDEQIAALYRSGLTTVEVGAKLGISDTPVRAALKRQGVQMRRACAKTGWLGTPEQVAEVVALYAAGTGVKPIAKKFACRDTLITQALADAGIQRHSFGRAARAFTENEALGITEEYRAGATLAALGRKHGVSKVTIAAWLERLGVARRPPETPRFWTDERKDEAVRRYQAGEAQQQIAAGMGISRAGVSAVLRTAGVTAEAKAKAIRRGEDHGWWKGGRIVTADGYILVQPAPSDVNLVRPNSNGYVFEHRLAMARSLGRPLLPGETVHHKDGDPAHNAIDNLQLRQGRHGTGVVAACLDCGSHNVGYVNL